MRYVSPVIVSAGRELIAILPIAIIILPITAIIKSSEVFITDIFGKMRNVTLIEGKMTRQYFQTGNYLGWNLRTQYFVDLAGLGW